MEAQKPMEINFSKQDLRRLIIPLVIEQLLAITVGLLDSVLVNAFSALATGGAAIAGQYLGRGEFQKAGHAGEQLLLFMIETSLIIMALFYLGKGFVLNVVFGQVDADVAAYADA